MSTGPNFIIIEEGIDTKKILKQLSKISWDTVHGYKDIGGDKTPPGFLPLIMAVVPPGTNPKDSEFLQKTPLFDQCDEVLRFLYFRGIKSFARAAFFKLDVGGRVETHIDEGNYYLTKDRYHLSLQGEYKYTVGGESRIIKPGTFFWFDNKRPHSAENISATTERITFVFDSPKSPNNPHHKVHYATNM